MSRRIRARTEELRLVSQILAIVDVFSCRLYGLRRDEKQLKAARRWFVGARR